MIIKKAIFYILIISITWLIWFGIDVYKFAEGVRKDVPKNIEFFKNHEKTKLEKYDQKGDTLNADDFNVLLFRPSELEFDVLLKEVGEDSGLYEVDSDFGYYASIIYDSISKTELKIDIVTERIIKYSTKNGVRYFDRLNKKEHPYGIIFNSLECDPKIEFGVMTDINFFQELADYNKYCK